MNVETLRAENARMRDVLQAAVLLLDECRPAADLPDRIDQMIYAVALLGGPVTPTPQHDRRCVVALPCRGLCAFEDGRPLEVIPGHAGPPDPAAVVVDLERLGWAVDLSEHERPDGTRDVVRAMPAGNLDAAVAGLRALAVDLCVAAGLVEIVPFGEGTPHIRGWVPVIERHGARVWIGDDQDRGVAVELEEAEQRLRGTVAARGGAR